MKQTIKYRKHKDRRTGRFDCGKLYLKEIEAESYEEAVQKFQKEYGIGQYDIQHPDTEKTEYSDVIELTQDASGSHFYFCDSVGFREVAFERKADISLLRLLCHPYFIELKALAKHGFVPISRGYAGPGIYYDDRNMTRYGTGSKQYYPAFRCCEWYENCRKRKPSDLAFCYTPYEKILGMETQVIKDEEEWYLQVEIRPDFQCIVLPNGTCWLA